MKRLIILMAAALMVSVQALAQGWVSINGVRMDRNGDAMVVKMDATINGTQDKGAVAFIPVVYKDSVEYMLRPIGLYSRNSFYSYARQVRSDDPFVNEPYSFYVKDAPSLIHYEDKAPFLPWMDGASLRIDIWRYGCCGKPSAPRVEGDPIVSYHAEPEEPEQVEEPEVPEEPQVPEEPVEPEEPAQPEEPDVPTQTEEPEPPAEPEKPVLHEADEYTEENVTLVDEEVVEVDTGNADDGNPEGVVQVYVPYFIYVQPEAEAVVKERAISGEAYVVFKSGATDVDAEYRDNEAELQKIRATIDSVKVDPDITITSIILRGYSSPDGAFSVNQDLSAKRVEAIRSYVEALFELPEEMWHSEAAGENWEGFRAAVEASSLPNKVKILELIDSDMDPDRKEHKISSKYPRDYKTIYNEIYPLLRRTDYKVMYTVRSYTTVEEVRQILETKPWNLSIKEFFLAAEGLEPGTTEFNKVFSVAARVFPDDPIAQINAANSAMAIGDLDAAAYHLDRAGDSPEARYAKGVLAALREDWETAARYFSSAELSGLEKAGEALEVVQKIMKQATPAAE